MPPPARVRPGTEVRRCGGGEIRRAVAGHFGELLQGRLGPDGPLVLVTLPAPGLQVTARLTPRQPFRVDGGVLCRRRAAVLHRAVAGGPPLGRLRLEAAMPPGGGAGASTAALLAAAAVFAAAGRRPLPEAGRLARLCLRLEGASDPLMYPEPARLLWMPRSGRPLGRLPPLPRLDIVGGFLGPPRPTDPSDLDFADVADLVADWAPAAARGDVAGLAALATASARRNASRRGGPDPAPLLAAAERFGALGIVAAHTGSARGLIFAPGRGRPELAVAGLAAIGVRGVSRFQPTA